MRLFTADSEVQLAGDVRHRHVQVIVEHEGLIAFRRGGGYLVPDLAEHFGVNGGILYILYRKLRHAVGHALLLFRLDYLKAVKARKLLLQYAHEVCLGVIDIAVAPAGYAAEKP